MTTPSPTMYYAAPIRDDGTLVDTHVPTALECDQFAPFDTSTTHPLMSVVVSPDSWGFTKVDLFGIQTLSDGSMLAVFTLEFPLINPSNGPGPGATGHTYSDGTPIYPDHGCPANEPEPEPEVDDRAPCRKCGAPMSDADYDDNHGLCSTCCEEEQP